MKDGPNIAHVAALIGDPARANMLTALMDGRALTASELAAHAGVTKQTASSHLARLMSGALIVREIQGRHHYFRLNGADVAATLEALMGIAAKSTGVRVRTGPKDLALRKARRCYDHLAGEIGVFIYQQMLSKDWLKNSENTVLLSSAGAEAMALFGIDIDVVQCARRPLVKPCLDWSMRKPHLAGGLGKAVFERMAALKWLKADGTSRVVTFNTQGEKALHHWVA